jgi:hypothetical protein
MVLGKCKKYNMAKSAIVKELVCYMMSMATDNIV